MWTVSSVLPESTTIRSSAQATEASAAAMWAASLRVMIVTDTGGIKRNSSRSVKEVRRPELQLGHPRGEAQAKAWA